MNILKRVVAILSSCVVMATGMFGCSSTNLAGTGTETSTKGTVTGTIVDQDGTAASHTMVQLVPAAYDPYGDTSLPAVLFDTSSSDGSYSFTHVDSGDYNIQAVHLDTRARALVRGISVEHDSITAPVDTLRKPGTIIIVLPDSIDATNGYVFVPGTTVYSLLRGTNGSVTLDSVPAGSGLSVCYAVNGSPAKPLIFRDSVFVAPGSVTTVTNVAWNFQKKLYLNTTVSGANVPGTVENFPMLVRLNAGNFNFSQAQAGGSDIRFAKSNGDSLPYEIERWDATLQAAEVWVKVDTVYGNDSTHFVNMYWGASTGSATVSLSNSAAVFDTAGGFGGVWHMNEAAGAPVKDATANHYDGTPSTQAPLSVAGMIGPSQEFDGTSTFLTMSGTAAGKLDFQEYGAYTVSAWVETDSLKSGNDSLRQYIVSKGNPEYTLQMNITKGWDFGEYVNATKWNYVASTGTARVWSYVVGVRSGMSMYLYINGVFADSTVNFSAVGIARNSTDLVIGSHAGGVNTSYFDGIIDEVRISSVSCSADWIKLCYMNQKSTDALIMFRN